MIEFLVQPFTGSRSPLTHAWLSWPQTGAFCLTFLAQLFGRLCFIIPTQLLRGYSPEIL